MASWHFAGARQLPQLADAPGLKLVTTTPAADAAERQLEAYYEGFRRSLAHLYA